MRRFLLSIAAIVCATTFAHAAEVDFNKKLLNFDGEPFRECVKVDDQGKCETIDDLTLGAVAKFALNMRDQAITVGQIFERGTIASKISRTTTGVLDLTSDEVSLIKGLIVKTNLSPFEKYAAIVLLDPATQMKETK